MHIETELRKCLWSLSAPVQQGYCFMQNSFFKNTTSHWAYLFANQTSTSTHDQGGRGVDELEELPQGRDL